MPNRRFILGLGAQKAGSTWARAYLNADSAADFGPLKEYHVWDAITLPELVHYDQRERSQIRGKIESLARRLLGKSPDRDGIRSKLQASPDVYFHFFLNILSRPGISVTGDITPSYAGLSPSLLRQIKDGFEELGVEVRVLFLMRDPVSRCISAAQMNRRRRLRKEGVPLDGTLDEAVLTYVLSKEAKVRANYKYTVETIESVFAKNDIYFGLYESMFRPDEIARMSQFAGVEFRPNFANEKVNAYPQSESVSNHTKEILRDTLSETYQFCAKRFPETEKLWLASYLPSSEN